MNKISGNIFAAGQHALPCCFWGDIPFFNFLSTSDISVTFAFYNGLTKGIEVRVMRKILLVDDNKAIAQELAKRNESINRK